MRKLPKNLLVEVWFEDISQDPRWQSQEERDKAPPPICITWGVIDHQTDSTLFLNHMKTVSTQSDADLTQIPIGCIVFIYQCIRGSEFGQALYKKGKK